MNFLNHSSWLGWYQFSKTGDRNLPENYRPISILPALSKVYEKLLYKITASFFEKNKIINNNQFGFQKKSGCLSAATQFVSETQNAVDKGPRTMAAAIIIDLKKAFDTVPHHKLLEKLNKCGIRGRAYEMYRSYLGHRRQFSSVKSIKSLLNDIKIGIPQGSNLGPLLFLLYINDLFSVNFRGTLILYADDAVLSYSGENIAEIYADMQHDLNLLCNWLLNNQLTINATKTKFIIFHSHKMEQQTTSLKLFVDGGEIERVTEIKYLGLIIRDDLKWNTHIDHIIRKTSGLVGALRRLNSCVPADLLKMIYYAHVHSYFSYLSPIWGNAAQEYKLKEIQIIQNRALRTIFGIDYYIQNISTTEIRKKYNILDIKQQIRMDTILLFYKIQHNLIKTNHVIVRGADVHDHGTRYRSHIITNKMRTNYGLLNVFTVGARLFNGLDPLIKDINTFDLFKARVKRCIMHS